MMRKPNSTVIVAIALIVGVFTAPDVKGATPVLVEKATYTGLGADPNDLSNPTNWSCTTAGQPVENGLPMSQTEITIPADKVFTCTNAEQVAFASVVFPTSIPGDSDWRGLGAAPINGTINLQGHKL